ncbi:MAG: nitronate monooxygenase [Caulobacteraceae bacterium]
MASDDTDTVFSRAFGLAAPIVQGPMGGISGPKLVAAVAEAGALGVLPIWCHRIDDVKSNIAATQAATKRPFAVNVRADLVQQEHIACALGFGVSIFHLFWGDPSASIRRIRGHGARIIATVSDGDTAKAALDAGAEALIAQGVEAGGHVFGSMPLVDLLELVLDLAGSIPVVAGGGIADGDDVIEALDRGAAGALLGTRFAATHESEAHGIYKQALTAADGQDTVRTTLFDIGWPEAPHRVLRNSTFRAWQAAGRPASGDRPGAREIVARIGEAMEYPRYHAASANMAMEGDIEAMALYSGMGVGKVTEIRSARQIIDEIKLSIRSRAPL